ncbi:MAG: hypothetical protein WCT22_00750 [Patescibacteria group bacterium]
MKTKQKIIIAGPCAAESLKQVIGTAKGLKKRGIKIMRASLWKPRTKPGFEGVGEKGLPWIAKVTQMGITMATEVLFPEQVDQVVTGVIENGGDSDNLLFWIGSRNQNHKTQKEIANRVHKISKKIKLMIKNQPWRDESHWLGIVDHVLSTGLSSDRIILCHRGFSSGWSANPLGLRNIPDWEMSMSVREKTNLPMIIDPSHIGGTVENVFRIAKESALYNFDGAIVEVHPRPKKAKTDAKQQLTVSQLDDLLKIL